MPASKMVDLRVSETDFYKQRSGIFGIFVTHHQPCRFKKRIPAPFRSSKFRSKIQAPTIITVQGNPSWKPAWRFSGWRWLLEDLIFHAWEIPTFKDTSLETILSFFSRPQCHTPPPPTTSLLAFKLDFSGSGTAVDGEMNLPITAWANENKGNYNFTLLM